MLKDSSLGKWVYKEHTRIKHELLRKYLYAWIIKLGKFHRKVIFFDGFAGRGEYTDEKTGKVLTLGSPIIDLQMNYYNSVNKKVADPILINLFVLLLKKMRKISEIFKL